MPALGFGALPSGGRGRALALALTALAGAILWLLLVQPLRDGYAGRREALDQRRILAGRMEDAAETLPQLRTQVGALAARPAPAAATVAGSDDAVASAALQGLLEGMASTAGAHLTSSEALPGETVGAYRRLGLRVTLDAKWPVLVALLQAVGRATPHMFVDDLQLHARIEPLIGSPGARREPALNAAFTLLAFRNGDVRPASEAASAPASGSAAPAAAR